MPLEERTSFTRIRTQQQLTRTNEQKNAPELPIGRFLKSMSLGGNRVILVVLPQIFLDALGVLGGSLFFVAASCFATLLASPSEASATHPLFICCSSASITSRN
jgi:hypothetical protein